MPRTSAALVLTLLATTASAADNTHTPTSKEILDASKPFEWRALDPADTLVMQLAGNRRVVIELAPAWAPAHVANIKTMVSEKYFDRTSVYRVQDNFVAQWGDPDSDDPKKARSMGTAKAALPPEYTRKVDGGFKYFRLTDGDVYAPEVGFRDGLPMARAPETGQAWLLHCYGMVGVARDVDPTSGNGNTLYTPIGQAPRQIDHQLAVVGRVVEGMPWLAALPRGPEPMGVYTDAKQRTPILTVRLASDLPAAQRPHLEVLRSDSASFAKLVEAKRNRKDDFYRVPAGHIDVCNVPLPVREIPTAKH
jgi:peptidylprolyl isomerase